MTKLPHRNSLLARVNVTVVTDRENTPIMQTWVQWQAEVVATLGAELQETLHPISVDDVDWAAWQDFYLEGRSPRAAVSRALERDL